MNWNQIIYGLVWLIGFLACIALLLWAIAGAIGFTIGLIKERNDTSLRWHLRNRISDLNTWCGYDFPILEDVKNWLMPLADGGGCEDISNFREILRNKYKVKP